MFYRGVEAHICRVCRAPWKLAIPRATVVSEATGRARTRGNGVQAGQSGAAAKSAGWDWPTPGTLSRNSR